MKIFLIALMLLTITGCQEEGKTVQETLKTVEPKEDGSLIEHVKTLQLTEDSTPTPAPAPAP